LFAYIVKRLLASVLVLVIVTMSIFVLFFFGPNAPARPVCDAQTSNRCTPERLDRYTEQLGYNNFWLSEYGTYMKGIAVGRDITVGNTTIECAAPCLGLTFRTNGSVWEEMKDRLPATFSIAIGGAALYLLIGVPIGVAAARRRGTVGDKALVSSFLVVSSVPYYLFALIVWLVVTIVIQVPVISDTGYFPITENPAKWFSGMVLAWLCLGIFNSTAYTRFTRGAMVETLSEDYIRTAKAKGLPARTVVYRHALRSALVPVVTIFGIDLGVLLAGTIFTERIFDIDGIGFWGLQAVGNKDLPIVEATVLFAAIVVIISNLIVDVVYSLLDPRVRLS
jgi:peptide/nickel transport system permease protein